MKVVVQGQGEKADFILIEPTKFTTIEEVESFISRLQTVAYAMFPRHWPAPEPVTDYIGVPSPAPGE